MQAVSILWLGRDTDVELSTILRHAARYGNAINNGMMRIFRKVRKSTTAKEHEDFSQTSILCKYLSIA